MISRCPNVLTRQTFLYIESSSDMEHSTCRLEAYTTSTSPLPEALGASWFLAQCIQTSPEFPNISRLCCPRQQPLTLKLNLTFVPSVAHFKCYHIRQHRFLKISSSYYLLLDSHALESISFFSPLKRNGLINFTFSGELRNLPK